MTNILILDTETTGIAKSDQVIELAYLSTTDEGITFLEWIECKRNNFENFCETVLDYIEVSRFKPTVPINPHAFDIHNIGLSQLKDCPSSTMVQVPEADYIVGHVISFDKRMLEQSNFELSTQLDNTKYICTKELAKAIEKAHGVKFENHKLDTLVEYYYPDKFSELVSTIHDAKGDVLKTLLVLLAMLEQLPGITPWDELYSFQESLKKVKK